MIRDDGCNSIAGASSAFAVMAEAHAIELGIDLVLELNCMRVRVQSNFLEVINSLNTNTGCINWKILPVLKAIRKKSIQCEKEEEFD